MPRRADRMPLLDLDIDEAAPAPLHRQLYEGLRKAILAGRLAPRGRLPSSRALASELGLSRNTVLAAFEQLASEGYLEARRGSGSRVAATLPDLSPPRRRAPSRSEAQAKPAVGLSARGLSLSKASDARATRGDGAFAPAIPDLDIFPFELWSRLLARSWRRPTLAMATGRDAGGYLPLRAAIADYLRRVRAVRCEPEQVIVLSGIRQAVDLAVRLLLDAGDRVWLEDPGYAGVREVLRASGARLVPVPVDGEGLSVKAGARKAPDARLVCVAPSHQYPLGTVMTLGRRLELLAWARQAGAWVIEDDYDSEFRYAGRPLAALQGLDEDGRVIYVGSFSKVLFPSLRLGYLVAPPALVDAFTAARSTLDDHAAMTAQPALAAFIAEGHFAAHIRRTRKLYAARQAALLAAADRHFRGLLELAPAPAGMHLLAGLAPALAARMDDRAATARAAAAGITVSPLSAFQMTSPRRQGLLLGYAGVPEDRIEPAAIRLAAALRP
ncbi:MAG TPA: PLP-dependent aminotransferase family protein [Hypericibacter adhaerens]|jgi:GntR family transcriptional regulator/MocR family aminotransferase|uniref:MocR-like pyridoxine biosynthesis transcription factor PdxR n=1 Tax=Hypericibacter adhaerens TaxID=2602016 RepID=UPI002BC12419|nr:PLP-dependent aminotransferase family protein [Hypericibacter adhaerens]HWA42773.1 PLP-dependent aminotransferase family protein [Hypericibacter adhaerens]